MSNQSIWLFCDIFNIYGESKSVDVIYFVFQKAFNKVKILLANIRAHGINSKVHQWLKNWLTWLKQSVIINGKASDCLNVTSGLPQESILGPVLFFIYISNIDDDLSCKISNLDDNAKIGNAVIRPLQRQPIQCDLNKLVIGYKIGRWTLILKYVKYFILVRVLNKCTTLWRILEFKLLTKIIYLGVVIKDLKQS